MSRELTLNQKAAIIQVSKVRGGVSTKIRKVTAEALVRLGYATYFHLPLVDDAGIKLTEAGYEYAATGKQKHHTR